MHAKDRQALSGKETRLVKQAGIQRHGHGKAKARKQPAIGPSRSHRRAKAFQNEMAPITGSEQFRTGCGWASGSQPGVRVEKRQVKENPEPIDYPIRLCRAERFENASSVDRSGAPAPWWYVDKPVGIIVWRPPKQGGW